MTLFRLRPGVREGIERMITAEEYERLRERRDPARHTVVKDRVRFDWHGTTFDLDDIHRPVSRSCQLLEVELRSEDQDVPLPDFLDIDREVTHDGGYANAQIALG